ncbi:MAG: hypothetical protein CMM02_08410 [Rhodopirellula sp.]|nr:hypothetical protein [Rhodopirellula sp.]|tara:strand:- start:72 stop:476 length:405 start_codon:yes stop_codon:yes gene_type:complete
MKKLSDQQKRWLDEHWHEYVPASSGPPTPWRRVRGDEDSALSNALKAAKAKAREEVPERAGERAGEGAPRRSGAAACSAPKEEHCVVCMNAKRSYCFVPCGHLCLCATCVQHPLCAERCPMCKTVGTPQRVFEV